MDPESTIEGDGRRPRSEGQVPDWLGRRYHVRRLLGRGGMGEVYLAVDEVLVCEVALKMLSPGLAEDGRAMDRLRDEVRLAQRVTHPNVCRTFDLEEIDGRWLVKMEYVAGQTLGERLRGNRLSVPEVVSIARQVCAGLGAAHRQGVIHRDLKPQNVMLEEKTSRVVLMDFGIARVDARPERTLETVSGTPEYMAPEQVRGRAHDRRVDLYALGCVLYEMLAGQRVFAHASGMAAVVAHANDTPPPLPPVVPEHLARLVRRLLEKDPERRPASAEEVAEALDVPLRRRWWRSLPVVGFASLATGVGLAFLLRPAHQWRPEIRQLPVYEESSTPAVLSPDGKSYAYDSDREGLSRIFVASVAGGTPHPLTPPRFPASRPRWTRDGKAVLFSGAGAVYRVPATGGAPEAILRDPSAGLAEDCGGHLVIEYTSSAGCPSCPRLALREPDGTERDLVRFGSGDTVGDVRCDRAGTQLVYALGKEAPARRKIRSDLWLLSLQGGSPRRLTDDQALNRGTFTPDGHSIIFSSTRSGQAHLYELPLDGSTEHTQLTFGDGFEYGTPDVSGDGRLVLYQVDQGAFQIFAQPLAGGTRRKITSSVFLDFFFPRPVPDGSALVTVAFAWPGYRPQVVTVPLDGGDAIPMGVDAEVMDLTPDGKEIVYSETGGSRILAIPRGGGQPRQVAEIPGSLMFMKTGPDGRVHFMIRRSSMFESWSALLEGGPATPDLPPPWTWHSLAPRGGWRAAYQFLGFPGASGPRWRVRFLKPGSSLDEPSARELEATGSVAWTADGKSWIYGRGGSTHRYFVETGVDVELPIAQAGQYSVSPDNETLYTNGFVPHIRRQVITNFASRR